MCSGLAGNGVMGDMLGQSGVTGFVKDVLPIASWVAQPFMLGAGAGVGEAGAAAGEGAGAAGFAGEAGGTYAGTALTAEEAAAAGAATDAAATGSTAAVADAAASDASTIPPLQDAGTGQVATDAGAGAGTGTQSADYLKKAKDALSLAGAAAGIVKALTPAPTPPTAPAALPPPQTGQDADISPILQKNALLFGADSPTTTDLTKGSAGMGNLGKVSLLGGTSKLGG